MTKKDFKLIAEVIKNSDLGFNRFHLAAEFAYMLATTNPRFDDERFMRACGCDFNTG